MNVVKQAVKLLIDLNCKQKLNDLLRDIKIKAKLGRDFKATTSLEAEIVQLLTRAIQQEYLTEAELLEIVDEHEENGGQHIFLLQLTGEGKEHLTSTRLTRAYGVMPPDVESVYARLPRSHIFFLTRGGRFIIKRVSTKNYEDKRIKRTIHAEGRTIDVPTLVAKRCVELIVIDPQKREVEIRVDRLNGDEQEALASLQQFVAALGSAFDFGSYLDNLNVLEALPKIVSAQDETFMSRDAFCDTSTNVTCSKSRAEKGSDIRQLAKWKAAHNAGAVSRSSLAVYWLYNGDKLHSIINMPQLQMGQTDVRRIAKVYLPAKMTANQVNHVVSRIRYYAS